MTDRIILIERIGNLLESKMNVLLLKETPLAWICNPCLLFHKPAWCVYVSGTDCKSAPAGVDTTSIKQSESPQNAISIDLGIMIPVLIALAVILIGYCIYRYYVKSTKKDNEPPSKPIIWIITISTLSFAFSCFCSFSGVFSINIKELWIINLTFINIFILIALNISVRNTAKQGIKEQIDIQKKVCLFKYKYKLFFKHRKIIYAKYLNMMEDSHCEGSVDSGTNQQVFDDFKNAMNNCRQDFLNLLPSFQRKEIFIYWMNKNKEYTEQYTTQPVIEFSKYSHETSPKLYDFFTVLEKEILDFP
jgi:hypothetical protein